MRTPQSAVGKKTSGKKAATVSGVRAVRVAGFTKMGSPGTTSIGTAAGTKFRIFLRLVHGSPMDVVSMTREGLPAVIFGTAADYLEMPKTQLYKDLRLSRSTLESRIKGNQALTPDEGDKIVRIARVLKRAANVLESEESAKQWLRHEIRSVGGVQPITLLDTEAGYELVMDTLGRIEQGIAA